MRDEIDRLKSDLRRDLAAVRREFARAALREDFARLRAEIADLCEAAETSLTESAGSPVSGAILEALDDEGWEWRAMIIRAGESRNRNRYSLSVLHNAAPLYEGARVFVARSKDHAESERGFGSVAGWFSNVRGNLEGLEGTFEINKGRPEIRESVRHAWSVSQRTGRQIIGFSHVVPSGKFRGKKRPGGGWDVQEIYEVESVDLVSEPAAGGRLIGPAQRAVA